MSYLEEYVSDSTLPSIRRSRSGVLEGTSRTARITTIEDGFLDGADNTRSTRVRISSAGARPTSPLFHQRSTSPNSMHRKQILELQDQVNLYKAELLKRDNLIKQLTSLDTAKKTTIEFSTSNIEEAYNTEKAAALAAARSDVAALQTKLERLQTELRETKIQVDIREEKIRELRLECETAKEAESQHSSMVSSMRQRIVEFETKYGNLEGAATRGEVAVSTLQMQLRESNDKILDLESRLRLYVSEKDKMMTQVSVWEHKYKEIISKFSSIISIDIGVDTDIETIISKFNSMVQENSTLRSKLYTMKEYVGNAEVETKACRETITRLVAEAEKEQAAATKFSLEIDQLTLERDTALSKKSEYDHELITLRERLESTQRAWQATRKELEDKELRFATIDREVRDSSMAIRTVELQMKGFIEQLASILSVDGLQPVQPYEEAIRDRVKAMALALKDKSVHIDMLESKFSTVKLELDRQFELQKSAEGRTKRVEADYFQLKEKIRSMEDELGAADALREGLRMDKEKYMHLLERLARVMNIESITVDMGFDMAITTLVSRAEQLTKMEFDSIQDKKTHIYNLQRKMKSLKEQLESRDLHIDLLRKKVAALEEKLIGKSEAEKEKDSEMIRNKKLIKLVERYKQELHETNVEMNELKARMLESADLRTRTIEQEQVLETLEGKVGQLERVRQKQAKKIGLLKGTLDEKTEENSIKHGQINQTIQALSSELRTTKSALEEITTKERQLLDLRQVVARMLGLDINTLAVPDYEIISRLEKLILAHQSSAVASATVDTVLTDMEEGFKAGYTGANKIITRSRSPTRKVTVTTKTRTTSPSRKKDFRAY